MCVGFEKSLRREDGGGCRARRPEIAGGRNWPQIHQQMRKNAFHEEIEQLGATHEIRERP
jgi:hypothetical protein